VSHSGILVALPIANWRGPFAAEPRADAGRALEDGKVVFLPRLQFEVAPDEADLLDPAAAGAARKNVSLDPATGAIGNTALSPGDAARLTALMARFAAVATALVTALVPGYGDALEVGRTSFRPLEIAGRDYSPRHDDRRLHIDAFPSRPLQGRRILRLFSNIAIDGAARHWQVGEPFADFAGRFLPRIGPPAPGSAWFLAASGITKGRRSRYDHVMLQLHDRAKLDLDYQRAAPKHDLEFPPGTTWLVFTDQVLHAALAGHGALEQTFYLPVAALSDPATAPLRVLERLTARPLV
jgi:3-deoxy-D-manno-oct-2-ulosonic acid (Kdo) hydroxylase